jgi:hypothetical protein
VAARHSCHNQIGTLYEEGAFALTELALPQRRRSFDEGVLRTDDGFA